MSGFLPKRLLDLGEEHSQSLKLYVCDPETDRLEYVTLSHCWGGNVRCRLTRKNSNELQHVIPMSKLPQNFRDAIFTCRGLSKRYLWIDSLCIIQDSNADWEEQSALMDLIYANSWCTISAVCAEESNQGFFRKRNPLLVHPCRLPSKIPLSVVLDTRYRNLDTHFKVPRPLYNRAWAFQERVLSLRVLQYGENQLSWECREMVAAESNPDGSFLRPSPMESIEKDDQKVRESLRRLSIIDHIDNRSLHDDFLTSWKLILHTYTSMKLTYPSDRLAAIFGVMKAQQRVTRFSYFEGLWLECFMPMLLWHAPYSAQRMAENVERPGSNWLYSFSSPANSLSWASVEGQIDYAYIWPHWREGVSQIAALDNTPVAKSCITLEREYKFTLDNYGLGGLSLWKSWRPFDDCIQAPPNYLYCASLKSIRPQIPSSKQPSIVRMEGPILRFRTEMTTTSWANRDWSHPFAEVELHSQKWFCPDMVELTKCAEGSRMDVACLIIIKWDRTMVNFRALLDRDQGLPGWQVLALAAGIVLVECSGRNVSRQTLQEKTYCRVGYFEFGFRSADFRPLRELTRVESVAII